MIRSVQRACALLAAFTPTAPRHTLAELSEQVGLPKPTVHRLAATLVECGLMVQHQDGRYGLGLRLIGAGAVARADVDLVTFCTPVMERLAASSGETVLLGVADWPAFEVTIVHRVDSRHELSVVSPVGRRSRITLGAIGKALLLGLDPHEFERLAGELDLSAHTGSTITERGAASLEIDRCRRLRFATESGEFLPGVSAVAAPVALVGTRPAGALAVVGPSTRLDQHLDAVGAEVRDAVARLGAGSCPSAASGPRSG